MLERTIKYEDFNGIQQETTHYFHMSKSELMAMEIRESQGTEDGGVTGGFHARLQSIIDSKNGQAIMDNFESIIKMSYGVKSEDGQTFIKDPDVSENFLKTPQYDSLFMELMYDSGKAAEFIRKVVPRDLSEEMTRRELEKNKVSDRPDPNYRPMSPAQRAEATPEGEGAVEMPSVVFDSPEAPKDITNEELALILNARRNAQTN